MKDDGVYSAAAAIVSIFGAKIWASWYSRYLYHGGYAHSELLPYLVLFAFFLGLVFFALSKTKEAARYTRWILVLVVLYLIWRSFPYEKFSTKSFPIEIKVLLWVTAILLARYISWKGNDEIWKRLAHALVASIVIYNAVPFAFAGFVAKQHISTLDFRGASQLGYSRNLVVLVFDETSPEYADKLLSKISAGNVAVQSLALPEAGKDTIDAIPSMLAGGRFGGVAPCGTSTLCGRSASIDFSTLSAPDGTVDVVGFWHPYCSILGLRSCFRELGVFLAEPGTAFFCQAPYVERFVDCSLKRGARNAHLASLQNAAFAAPFWKQGGTLLVHLPNPHPTMEGRGNSLVKEYQENFISAATFVEDVLVRLQDRFSGDYSLVIMSDHPLRKGHWCKSSNNYLRNSCDGLPEDRGQVPYIVINSKMSVPRATTAAGILGSSALIGDVH